MVATILRSAGQANLVGLEPLLIVPEYRIPLPGGKRASQTDVLVLARGATGLVTIAVEGKVDTLEVIEGWLVSCASSSCIQSSTAGTLLFLLRLTWMEWLEVEY
jgi:hypothetical protein